eukprot:CAMPEP_0172606430 /NCGR_PEP_ID=MMETSP1068-20121228/26626_1 /TAXON_ID=35684 /ORGANISM="Pseudopedinella elastica, Strain CCMP716" /LENGTH=257 /DNA_ID=CAMNT_0013409121 /DNA_START=38 /DNA_END=811 /DNA_ORIENTATION=+
MKKILSLALLSGLGAAAAFVGPQHYGRAAVALQSGPQPGETREERLRRRELARLEKEKLLEESPSGAGSLIGQLPCDCKSGKYYAGCCGPVHEAFFKETNNPQDAMPKDLIRARYSAHPKGLADFIIGTTHPTHPEYTTDVDGWRREIVEFCKCVEFIKFKVLSEDTIDETTQTVTWAARMRVLPSLLSEENVQTKEFTERSIFVLEDDRWWYAGPDEEFEATNVLVEGPKPKKPPGGPKPKAPNKAVRKTAAASRK